MTLAALLLLGGLICGTPLLMILLEGVAPTGRLSLVPLLETLQGRSVQRALWHSFETSLLSALLALVYGTVLACLVGLTDARARGFFIFLVLLPMMIPPHVTAIAWIQALGPGSALLLWLGIAPEIGTTHPLYSREGIVALLAIQHGPLVLLVMLAALRSLPGELSDASRVFGANVWLMLRRIVLPLLLPNMIAAFALAFVSALGNFGIQALLGIPARYTTLPVLIWRRMSSFGPEMLTNVSMISMIVGLMAITAVGLQAHLQRRGHAQLIGLPQRSLGFRLGRWRLLVELVLLVLVCGVLVLPMLSLLATALTPTYGVRLTLSTLTGANFEEILLTQSVTLRAFMNSTLIAGLAAVMLAAYSVGIGFFLIRRRGVARRAATSISGLADVSYALPGLVISIACILAFIRPLPLIEMSIYNTLLIILVAYLAAFLSVALKPVAAAYLQIDPSLDDAARVAGARFGRRLFRIFLPLVAPAAASGAILVFLTAYNEVTVSALLWSTGNETIGTTIFNYEDGGYTTLAAAMSVVTVLATIMLMLVLDIAGRRAPPGVVPWRD
ncbi:MULTISPECIES: iron ABC transporter permease [unclassified Minwuia]|jgi:iron(III) transport system permease protein|uniref:ABC transporter permease n=1 Tax=unclassified Minwuia TaxID=2618799 RepID=UPI00247AF070|nr:MULTISPECIES: iron ABC transporter permease [unclassified Minwuia]